MQLLNFKPNNDDPIYARMLPHRKCFNNVTLSDAPSQKQFAHESWMIFYLPFQKNNVTLFGWIL